jgi:hypothetical protein
MCVFLKWVVVDENGGSDNIKLFLSKSLRQNKLERFI